MYVSMYLPYRFTDRRGAAPHPKNCASSYTQTVQKSMSIYIRHKTHTWGDFRLPPRSRWDLRSSGVLHSE